MVRGDSKSSSESKEGGEARELMNKEKETAHTIPTHTHTHTHTHTIQHTNAYIIDSIHYAHIHSKTRTFPRTHTYNHTIYT